MINDPNMPLPEGTENRTPRDEPEAFYLSSPELMPEDSLPAPAPEQNDKLEAALDYGMEPVPGGGARGIVVLKDGRLAAERYAEGYDRNTLLLGWSMTKSLTGMAVGAYLAGASGDSLAPAPPPDEIKGLFPEIWQDKRSEIALADLLRMNSGLAWNEGYGSITDATVMLHERPDFADFALRSQLIEEAGTVWACSSGTTNILME